MMSQAIRDILYDPSHSFLFFLSTLEHIMYCMKTMYSYLKFIGTNDMAADVLTKSLANAKHEHSCLMLGMEMML